MFSYFYKNGYAGTASVPNVYKWIIDLGYNTKDVHVSSSSWCREITFNGDVIGKCFCDYREELPYETLMYFGQNDMLKYFNEQR